MPAAVSAAATPVVGDFGASDDSDVWQPAMTDDGNVYYFHKVCCVCGVCVCASGLTMSTIADDRRHRLCVLLVCWGV